VLFGGETFAIVADGAGATFCVAAFGMTAVVTSGAGGTVTTGTNGTTAIGIVVGKSV